LIKSRGSFLAFISLVFGFSHSHATEFPVCQEHYVVKESQTTSVQIALEKILKNNPDDVECMLKLASLYFRNNNVANGFDLVRRAYSLNPHFVEKRNVSKVLDLALRLSRLKELASKNADKELWNELGNTYFDMGIFKEAAEAFEESLRLDTNQSKIEILLALCYGNLDQMKKSAALLKKIVSKEPYNFYANYYYGKVLKNELNQESLGMQYLKMADYILYFKTPSFDTKDEKHYLENDLKHELEEN
jgi:cytochrome c-type biogenesis protein CcmH/NrfG